MSGSSISIVRDAPSMVSVSCAIGVLPKGVQRPSSTGYGRCF
jgi:hypothetical protein